MQLLPLYLAEIQAAEERGEQAVIMRQLRRRVGELSVQVQDRIKSLPVEKLENLGDALLDFAEMGDLTTWLDANC
jgi:heme oxygenase